MLYALSLRSSPIGPIRVAARYVHHFTRYACGKALLLTCWVARSETAPDAPVPFLWQSSNQLAFSCCEG